MRWLVGWLVGWLAVLLVVCLFVCLFVVFCRLVCWFGVACLLVVKVAGALLSREVRTLPQDLRCVGVVAVCWFLKIVCACYAQTV